MAGEFFFDVKPNGDMWICQDHPTRNSLNILDPEFEKEYGREDFSHRRDCGGCTYSCYYVTQKSFEPQTWPGMAGIWWKTTTQPGEACRETAQRHGWAAGLLHLSAARLLLSAHAAARTTLWMGLLIVALLAVNSVDAQTMSEPADPQQIVSRMEQCNHQRAERLTSYTGRRRYYAANPFFHRDAYSVVEMKFQAPDVKEFRVVERGGSGSIQNRVFVPMVETERVNARSPAREATEISTRNYTFTYQGYDAAAQAHIFLATPHNDNKYLFRGKVWISADDFAIQRIEGEPAKNQSFWIRKTRFVHEYQKFGGFWFPVSNRTVVELKIFGRSVMNIDYFGYAWEPSVAAGCIAPATQALSSPQKTAAGKHLGP